MKKFPPGPVPRPGDSLEKKRIAEATCKVFKIIQFFHIPRQVAQRMDHLSFHVVYTHVHIEANFTTKKPMYFKASRILLSNAPPQPSEKMRGTVANRRQEH
jgi:hypothetical protein